MRLEDLTPGQLHLLMESLGMFARIAYDTAEEHGFWDEFRQTQDSLEHREGRVLADKHLLDTKLSKIALMHSELGEMTEGVRKPREDEHCPEFTSEEVEAADTFIRLMDYVGKFNLRFAEAVIEKMRYNSTRPYKHGKGA